MEDKLIRKAIDSTIKKCLEYPKLAQHEILIQDCLYNELCDELSNVDPKYPSRIREEYSLYERKESLPDPHEYWVKVFPRYIKNYQEIKEDFRGKGGKYDLVILDKERKNVLHAIEIKIITSYDSLIHRGYEDIYVLSDLLKMYNKEAQGYILIIGWYNSKPRARISKQGMQKYLERVHEAYKKAGVDSHSVRLDKKLIE